VIHPKWLERHIRHARDALTGLEHGDDQWTCYNARISIEALAKGILGYPPYGLGFSALRSLIARVLGSVPECVKVLEAGGDAVRCVRCMEELAEALTAAAGLSSSRP